MFLATSPASESNRSEAVHNMVAIKIIFGLACGAIVGLALGVIAATALGLWSAWANPDDPSAGSVAIVVIATAPVGAVLGSLTIAKLPRLFLATFLPLAIFFVGLHATITTLRGMDRPRTFVLDVNGTPGAEYVGVVSVDGDEQQVKGNIPARFEFEAFRIELALALVAPNGENNIAVETAADGNDLQTGIESQTGVHLQLKSVGYSETFGGTSHVWHGMSPEEVDRLVKERVMPRGMWRP